MAKTLSVFNLNGCWEQYTKLYFTNLGNVELS